MLCFVDISYTDQLYRTSFLRVLLSFFKNYFYFTEIPGFFSAVVFGYLNVSIQEYNLFKAGVEGIKFVNVYC